MVNYNLNIIVVSIICCILLTGTASAWAPYLNQSSHKYSNFFLLSNSGQESNIRSLIVDETSRNADNISSIFGTDATNRHQLNINTLPSIDKQSQPHPMKSLQLNSNKRNNLFISDQRQSSKNTNETQALIPINPDDPIILKIHDTTLLLLIDPNYRKTMDPDLNPIGALINKGVWINDPILGEMAIIEIYLKPSENPVRVEQYAYQVRGYYPNENVVVATVPINNIYSIISLSEVNSINLVIPGITN